MRTIYCLTYDMYTLYEITIALKTRTRTLPKADKSTLVAELAAVNGETKPLISLMAWVGMAGHSPHSCNRPVL